MGDKIPFYALDLRNISRLVKTKTKTRAQCLMVNTGSLSNWNVIVLVLLVTFTEKFDMPKARSVSVRFANFPYKSLLFVISSSHR